MITVLDHAPVRAIDYSMMADAIRAYALSDSTLPTEKLPFTENKQRAIVDPEVPRIKFQAGSYIVSAPACLPSVIGLADRLAKHGVKAKAPKGYTLKVAHDQVYALGTGNTLTPIMMEAGGKYKYINDTKGVKGVFIVHKAISGKGYSVTCVSAGLGATGSGVFKKPDDAIAAFHAAIDKIGADTLSASISRHESAYENAIKEAGL